MSKKFEITKAVREAFFEMPKAHYHEVYEIYYLISGKSRFFIKDTIYTVNSGDFIIIPERVLHKSSYIGDRIHERYDMYLTADIVNRLFDRFGEDAVKDCFSEPLVTVPSQKRGYAESILENIYREYVDGDMFSQVLTETLIDMLTVFLLRLRKENSSRTAESAENTDGISQKAAKYIFSNYNKDITLDSVAQYVKLSRSHFSKKFKEDTGFGFKEYLLNIRVKYAAEYLLNTKMPIRDIAAACGFTDSNYFGDAFRRVKGVSPSVFRKRGKEE